MKFATLQKLNQTYSRTGFADRVATHGIERAYIKHYVSWFVVLEGRFVSDLDLDVGVPGPDEVTDPAGVEPRVGSTGVPYGQLSCLYKGVILKEEII